MFVAEGKWGKKLPDSSDWGLILTFFQMCGALRSNYWLFSSITCTRTWRCKLKTMCYPAINPVIYSLWAGMCWFRWLQSPTTNPMLRAGWHRDLSRGEPFPTQGLLPPLSNTCSSASKLPGCYKQQGQPEHMDKQFPACAFACPPAMGSLKCSCNRNKRWRSFPSPAPRLCQLPGVGEVFPL